MLLKLQSLGRDYLLRLDHNRRRLRNRRMLNFRFHLIVLIPVKKHLLFLLVRLVKLRIELLLFPLKFLVFMLFFKSSFLLLFFLLPLILLNLISKLLLQCLFLLLLFNLLIKVNFSQHTGSKSQIAFNSLRFW